MLRELDHRTDAFLSVWLLWHITDDRVIVSVADERTGERFQLEVRDGERALDVFHHPYAYSGRRGIGPTASSASPGPSA